MKRWLKHKLKNDENKIVNLKRYKINMYQDVSSCNINNISDYV